MNSLSKPFLDYYLCPLCQTGFVETENSWVCKNNHTFDIAKQGYVHLLPVHHKKSKIPGDDAKMVLARKDFLNTGFYQPLRDELVSQIKSLPEIKFYSHLLDIGCGEGYYTAELSKLFQHTTAFDIAKKAVMNTSKILGDNAQALVASAAHLPIKDACVDVATSIFSPIMPKEYARVIQPNGYLLIAKPQAEHLLALRQELFDQVVLHDSDKFIEQLQPYFTLQHTKQVTTEFQADNASINNLLTMTPYAYKAKPDKRALVEALPKLTLQAKFTIYVFQLNQQKQ